MRKKIITFGIFVLIIFAVGTIIKPPEENYYEVGSLKVFVSGEQAKYYEFALLSERPLNVDWDKLINSRIEIVIPYRNAKDRTTIVYRIQQ